MVAAPLSKGLIVVSMAGSVGSSEVAGTVGEAKLCIYWENISISTINPSCKYEAIERGEGE